MCLLGVPSYTIAKTSVSSRPPPPSETLPNTQIGLVISATSGSTAGSVRQSMQIYRPSPQIHFHLITVKFSLGIMESSRCPASLSYFVNSVARGRCGRGHAEGHKRHAGKQPTVFDTIGYQGQPRPNPTIYESEGLARRCTVNMSSSRQTQLKQREIHGVCFVGNSSSSRTCSSMEKQGGIEPTYVLEASSNEKVN